MKPGTIIQGWHTDFQFVQQSISNGLEPVGHSFIFLNYFEHNGETKMRILDQRGVQVIQFSDFVFMIGAYPGVYEKSSVYEKL